MSLALDLVRETEFSINVYGEYRDLHFWLLRLLLSRSKDNLLLDIVFLYSFYLNRFYFDRFFLYNDYLFSFYFYIFRFAGLGAF